MSMLNAHILLAEANRLKGEVDKHHSNVDYWRVLLANLEAEKEASLVGPSEYKQSKRELDRKIKRNLRKASKLDKEERRFRRKYYKTIRRLWDIP